MSRLLLGLLVASAVLLATAGTASAQSSPYNRPNYGPYYRPNLSPFLNLLRGGDPAANYFLGVIPEYKRRENDRIFRSELQELNQRVQTTAEEENLLTPLSTTGHPTAFGNTGTYFGQSQPTTGVRPPQPPGRARRPQ